MTMMNKQEWWETHIRKRFPLVIEKPDTELNKAMKDVVSYLDDWKEYNDFISVDLIHKSYNDKVNALAQYLAENGSRAAAFEFYDDVIRTPSEARFVEKD